MNKVAYEILQKEIYRAVMEKMDFDRDLSDKEIFDLIDEVIVSESKARTIEVLDRGRLKKDVYYAIRKLDVLQQFIDNPEITEIMVNGKEHIFVEKGGELLETDCSFQTEEKLNNLIMQIVSKRVFKGFVRFGLFFYLFEGQVSLLAGWCRGTFWSDGLCTTRLNGSVLS